MSFEYQEAYQQAKLQREIGERKMADAMGLRECCGQPPLIATDCWESPERIYAVIVICSNPECPNARAESKFWRSTIREAAALWNKRMSVEADGEGIN
jgi:hypothetical protein